MLDAYPACLTKVPSSTVVESLQEPTGPVKHHEKLLPEHGVEVQLSPTLVQQNSNRVLLGTWPEIKMLTDLRVADGVGTNWLHEPGYGAAPEPRGATAAEESEPTALQWLHALGYETDIAEQRQVQYGRERGARGVEGEVRPSAWRAAAAEETMAVREKEAAEKTGPAWQGTS